MKTKPLTFLLALTFLLLFCGSVFADDFQDAVDAYKRKDYETVYKLYLPLAEKGDAKAQTDLEHMYDRGHGVLENVKEAFKWWKLTVEQGYTNAQTAMGGIYHMGRGVQKDGKEAEKWFRLAVEQEDFRAQSILGIMYTLGQRVPINYKEAAKWY